MVVSAVIVSAGNSTRMGGINKQFLELDGVPVIVNTITMFQRCNMIDEIIIVTRESKIDAVAKLVEKYDFYKVNNIVAGGETRQLSVYEGVTSTSNIADLVVIHDGARPLVTVKVIEETIKAAAEYGAAATGVKVKDTVKVVDDNDNIIDTPDRAYMRFIQTPQVFDKKLYLDAVASVENSKDFTDDCKLLEAYGKTVKFVDGDYENIKITTPEDIELAENYLKRRRDNNA
ncbi:MAG: 2-C-methyl-D-erythritol 4-phosphate cytidylyltransferase [Ruminococcaceae bacterium]|nr:2-C-methyl-D-erythritol 4-phosphate cytidylyltransferase [Oscillospiraceae bacterium]